MALPAGRSGVGGGEGWHDQGIRTIGTAQLRPTPGQDVTLQTIGPTGPALAEALQVGDALNTYQARASGQMWRPDQIRRSM
jgi:hypothetical protein